MKNLIFLFCLILIGGCCNGDCCLEAEAKVLELESKLAKVMFDGKWVKGEVYRNSEDPSQNGLIRFFVNENRGEYKRFWAAPFAYNNDLSTVQFDTVYSQIYSTSGYYSARNLKKNLDPSDAVYQPRLDTPFGINIHSGHYEGGEHTKIHRNTSIGIQGIYSIISVSPVDPLTNQLIIDPTTNQPIRFNVLVETVDYDNLPTTVDKYWAMKVGVAGGQDVYSLSINHTHQ
jgi:hypothetical protein